MNNLNLKYLIIAVIALSALMIIGTVIFSYIRKQPDSPTQFPTPSSVSTPAKPSQMIPAAPALYGKSGQPAQSAQPAPTAPKQ